VTSASSARTTSRSANLIAKDHGPNVKNDKQYEGLKKKGMSKSRAAEIAKSRSCAGTTSGGHSSLGNGRSRGRGAGWSS
jgi:hypothetical protein